MLHCYHYILYVLISFSLSRIGTLQKSHDNLSYQHTNHQYGIIVVAPISVFKLLCLILTQEGGV